MSAYGLSRGVGQPLTLTELDLGDAQWVAWVRKVSLQAYVAKTFFNPDRDLLLSVASIAQRWDCSRQYVHKLIKSGDLELTAIEDLYGHKLAYGVTYKQVAAYEKQRKKRGLTVANQGLTVQP